MLHPTREVCPGSEVLLHREVHEDVVHERLNSIYGRHSADKTGSMKLNALTEDVQIVIRLF